MQQAGQYNFCCREVELPSMNTLLARIQRLHIHQRLYLIAAAILLLGTIAAAIIVISAPPEPDTSYLTDGADFPVAKEYSRKYQYDVARIGGQSGLLAAQLSDWFDGLWQGRQLGYTIATLAACAAVGFLFFGRLLSVRVTRRKQ